MSKQTLRAGCSSALASTSNFFRRAQLAALQKGEGEMPSPFHFGGWLQTQDSGWSFRLRQLKELKEGEGVFCAVLFSGSWREPDPHEG
jgi:hypothetical protein